MEWKLFCMTFFVVFLAELGDKTQITTMCLAAGNSDKRWTVFYAAASALVLSSLIGVVVGQIISLYVNMRVIRIGAGILFVALGIFYILGSPGFEDKKRALFPGGRENMIETESRTNATAKDQSITEK